MMAAELQSVSPRVAGKVQEYFKDFQSWLKRQFDQVGSKDANRLAIGFLSTLEGSVLLGRLNNDPEIVASALQDYVTS